MRAALSHNTVTNNCAIHRHIQNPSLSPLTLSQVLARPAATAVALKTLHAHTFSAPVVEGLPVVARVNLAHYSTGFP